MARKNASPYRRLPGGRLTRYSLWQADDHLLHVQRREFTERYTRFYFRDIQAILVQRTSNHVILATVFVSLTILCALLAVTRENTGVAVFWWIMTTAFGAVAAWNWLLGPTCICYFFTAIDRYRVRSLSRVSIANQVIDILKPVIQRAQQDIDTMREMPEMAEKSSDQRMYLRQTHVHATHVRPVTPPPVLHYHGTIHIAVFVLLLINGLLLGGVLLMHDFFSIGGYAATLLSLGVCAVIALVKQAGTDIPNSVKGFTWGMLGYMGVSFVTGFAFLTAALYKYVQAFGQELSSNEFTMVKASTYFSPTEFPVFTGIYLVLIASAWLVGALGLIFLRHFRQEYMSASANTV